MGGFLGSLARQPSLQGGFQASEVSCLERKKEIGGWLLKMTPSVVVWPPHGRPLALTGTHTDTKKYKHNMT